MTRLRDGMGVLLSLFVWLWGTTLTTRKFFRIPNFFLLFALAASTAGAAPLKLEVRAHWLPNLLYQLDCTSLLLEHCSDGAYRELWEKEFLRTPADHEAFSRWKNLFSRYRGFVETAPRTSATVEGRPGGVQLLQKARIAGFQAKDPSDWATRLDLILTPEDRAIAQAVVAHFEKPFRAWWARTAQGPAQKIAHETQALLKRADLSRLIDGTRRFFRSVHRNEDTLTFNLYYRPLRGDGNKHTNGQQIERYSVSEFLPQESANERLDVVIHELVHFFWETAEIEEFAQTEKRWRESNDPLSLPLFTLLNETIATSIGNAWAGELLTPSAKWKDLLAKPNSFYNDAAIDQSAKVLWPFIRQWIEAKKTFFDPEFQNGLIALSREHLREMLERPSIALRTLQLMIDEKIGVSFKDDLRKHLRVSSVYTSTGAWSEKLVARARAETRMSALLVLPKENLEKAEEFGILSKEQLRSLRKSLGDRDTGLASVSREGSTARLYVLIAPNRERAGGQLERLAKQRHAFEGLLPH